jgi:drug/metabolite transporter (DMT)-like permease
VSTRADNLPLAIGALTLTVFALSLGDAFIKQISTGFGLWQLFFLRSCIALPVLLAAIAVAGRSPISQNLLWVAIRSSMLILCWIFYYASLPHLSLAVAVSILYTLPLFITLFSALWLGEPLTRNSLLALGLGFVGVVIILRPDAAGVEPAAILPLIAAICYALTMIITRAKCRDEHPLVIGASLNLGFIVFGLVGLVLVPTAPDGGFLTAVWVPMEMSEWTAMGLLSLSILIGSVGTAIAYQNGPASVLGVFDFGYVGFAVIWGILLFGEVPDAATFLGIGLIVASGVLSVRNPAGR